MANYNLVVNSKYDPFNTDLAYRLTESYKTDYNNRMNEMNTVSDNLGEFDYLRDYAEDSDARNLYESLANDLETYSKDFAKNGFTPGNSANWLNMRRKYGSVVKRLNTAQTALQNDFNERQKLIEKDPSYMYATDMNTATLDDYLDNKRPNLYGISGNQLMQIGAQIGAADSAKIWNDPKVGDINGQYLNIIEKVGRDPELMKAWAHDLDMIPELRDSINSVLDTYGVTQNFGEGSDNYNKAKSALIEGIINGSTYKQVNNIQRNQNYMSPADKLSLQLRALQNGLTLDENGNLIRQDAPTDGTIPEGFYVDPNTKKLKVVPNGFKRDPNNPSGLIRIDNNNETLSRIPDPVQIEWTDYTDEEYNHKNDDKYKHVEVEYDDNKKPKIIGSPYNFDELPEYVQNLIRKETASSNMQDLTTNYSYYYIPSHRKGSILERTKAKLLIVPKEGGSIRVSANTGETPISGTVQTDSLSNGQNNGTYTGDGSNIIAIMPK